VGQVILRPSVEHHADVLKVEECRPYTLSGICIGNAGGERNDWIDQAEQEEGWKQSQCATTIELLKVDPSRVLVFSVENLSDKVAGKNEKEDNAGD
jgi:hypothetical protein